MSLRRRLVPPALLRMSDDQRDSAHRTTGSSDGLDRERAKQEILVNERVEIAELLNHADIVLEPRAMCRVMPFVGIIHPDEVSSEQCDLFLYHPLRRFRGNMRPDTVHILLAPHLIDTSPADKRSTRAHRHSRRLLGLLEILDRDRLADLAVSEVEEVARQAQL